MSEVHYRFRGALMTAKAMMRELGEGCISGSGNVWEDLDVVMTRDEWAALNARHGTDYAYPFADVIPFPTPPSPKENTHG